MSTKDILEQTIKEIATQVFDERLGKESIRASLPGNVGIDPATQERINAYELLSRKPFLTKKELALYLDVSERSITEWSSRPPDRNPLPEFRVGNEPRYKRDTVDEWAEREAGLRRLRAVS